ncbi:MAG: hypothetical protein RLZZ511_3640 [Cyanobacteriota bacterium]
MALEELSKYIDPERLDYLERQQALFEAAKSELMKIYCGQYIAFEDGQVLDHDWDDRAMAERVYQKYGYRDIFMNWVAEQEPVYHVGGAFSCVKFDGKRQRFSFEVGLG